MRDLLTRLITRTVNEFDDMTPSFGIGSGPLCRKTAHLNTSQGGVDVVTLAPVRVAFHSESIRTILRVGA